MEDVVGWKRDEGRCGWMEDGRWKREDVDFVGYMHIYL